MAFNPSFSRVHRRSLRATLHNFTQRVLGGEEVSSEATEVILVLILKEDNLSSIRDFRPLSLCNVCVKVIPRMIVNRLKELLGDMITPN